MAVGVLLHREDLHLPSVGLTIVVGVIVEWVGRALPWARYVEDFAAIVQPVVIGVGIVGVCDVLIQSIDYFLAIVEAIVVRIEHRGVGEGKLCRST